MADMTRVGMRIRGAEVVTVPIDDTLTIEGQAADAKATGDALALKADKSELQAAVKVNNQPADAQGLILIDGRHIPVSDEDAETLAEAVTDLKGQTAENIPMSSNSGAKTIAEVVNANAEAIESMEEMTGATMPIESGSQTTVKAAIEARVKTVNQKAPDTDGNVDLSVVPLAENLQSDKMQSVDGTFIIRTTGGSSSVSDGKAYPQHIMGTSERTGYVAEELNMTVIPIERTEPDEPITATIDRDVFVAYVDESSTINLYYTTEWSEDPELYGVTVEGTPVAGDQIQIVYVKEDRGTILVSNPGRLVGTGWNLFNFNAGYARVVRYSDEYGYKIGGAFTSIEYSATPEGDRVSIIPGQNGLFQVPGDGYVFVNGGNATNTYILATWSDWTEGPATGYWEAYKESGIDLSAVMGTYFPYGMLSVGTIHDEIDLSAKRTISRVERMAYTAENLEAAIETGREYTYDTNYIYLERAEYVISAITIDTVYNVSEHGMEWFTETNMPLITEILYGKNLRDKLERDVLTISQQTLAEEEKAQVRRNIGVMDPPTNGYGTAAQLLKTNGDGTTEWTTQGTPTDAQVGTAVSAWLTAHPEATTTVQDGAISRAKLNDDLKAKTDAVPDLESEISENEKTKNQIINVIENAETDIPLTWENGHIDATTGQDTAGTRNQRAISYIPLYGKTIKVKTTNGNVAVYLYEYDGDYNFLEVHGTTTSYKEPTNQNTVFVRISTYSVSVSQSDLHTYVVTKWANNESLAEINSNISIIKNSFRDLSVSLGAFDNGIEVPFDVYARTENMLVPPFEITVNDGYEIRGIVQYSADGSFVQQSNGNHLKWLSIADATYIYKLVFAKPDTTSISYGEVGKIIKSFKNSNNVSNLSDGESYLTPYSINANGKISPPATLVNQSMIIKVKPGKKIRILTRSNGGVTIAFLRSWDYFHNHTGGSISLTLDNADFCEEYPAKIETTIAGYDYIINAPSDCNYLYVFTYTGYTPQKIEIDGFEYITQVRQYTEKEIPEYLQFQIAGLKKEGDDALRTSIMQKPTLDSSGKLTMVCESGYSIYLIHYPVDLSTSVPTGAYGMFTGSAPGLYATYPNYAVRIKKSDGSNLSDDDIATIKELVENGHIYININKTVYDITKQQRIAEYSAAIRSAVIKTSSALVPEQKGENASPLFVHFSDVHGDSERLRRIYKYANEIGANAIINTGDTVVENATNSALFAQDMEKGYTVPVYVVVGNHDAGTLTSYAADYENNVKYYAEKYGYNNTELPYYYVDLSTWKIRMITLCLYNTRGANPEFSQAQLDWLISTLQSVPDGYGVVLLAHGAYRWPNGETIEEFTQYDALGYPWYGAYEQIGVLILPLISAFIQRTTVSVSQTFGEISVSATADFSQVPNTAEFICHIHGHAHRDVVGYYTQDGVKQLTIGVDCATAHMGDVGSYTYSFCSELARTFYNEQQDLFNLIGFDRVRKYVKVCRVGASLGINMRTRNPIIAQYYFSE